MITARRLFINQSSPLGNDILLRKIRYCDGLGDALRETAETRIMQHHMLSQSQH